MFMNFIFIIIILKKIVQKTGINLLMDRQRDIACVCGGGMN